jgi:hypothetical protein
LAETSIKTANIEKDALVHCRMKTVEKTGTILKNMSSAML